MYRNELKYVIDSNTAQVIINRMEKCCEYDKHADQDGFYRVSSLYFDDYNNTALDANLNGQKNRKKYRIRVYDGKDGLIRLEKKVKHNQGGYKESCIITKEQYELVMINDYQTLKDQANHPLMMAFCMDGISRRLRPRTIVDYYRKSFVYEFGTVRITFDYLTKHSTGGNDLFDLDQVFIPMLDSGKIIMEVKFTGFLPTHIKNMVQQSMTSRQSVSKYTLSRVGCQ